MTDGPIRTDDGGVAKVAGAISGISKNLIDPLREHFQRKAEQQTQANANLSAAQHGDNSSHFEMLSKLLDQSHGHDVKMLREKTRAAKAMAKIAGEIAGPSKSGTRKTVQVGADGETTINHTTAAAARQKARTTAEKVAPKTPKNAAKPAPKPAPKSPRTPKTNPANTSRGGKK